MGGPSPSRWGRSGAPLRSAAPRFDAQPATRENPRTVARRPALCALAIVLTLATAMRDKDHRAPVKSAERALFILAALSLRASSFTELHLDLHYPRSSLHGLLGTMERLGWVRRGDDKRYRLIRSLTATVVDDEATPPNSAREGVHATRRSDRYGR